MADVSVSGVALVNPVPAIITLQADMVTANNNISAATVTANAAQTTADASETAAAQQQIFIARGTGVDLNLAGDGLILGLVTLTKAIPRRIVITNASTSLAASPLTASIRTAAGGAGTAVVAVVSVTALTAAGKFKDQTIAALTDVIDTGGLGLTLFLNITVEHGAPATADIFVYGDILGT